MIEAIVSIDLFVDEKLEIKKNRLAPDLLNGQEKRISIVTGIHGDELEGQYVCYELIRRIKADMNSLKGIIDVYPTLNPLGMDSISRGFPLFDMDMNRIFPGSETGAVAEYAAAKIIADINGSDLCIDVHSSNIFLRELPQIRLTPDATPSILAYCKRMNMELIWENSTVQVQHATLAHSLTSIDVPTMVVEMGVGMRITPSYGQTLVDGIMNVMSDLGIWEGSTTVTLQPRIISDNQLTEIRSESTGIFIPIVQHGSSLKAQSIIGHIIDPLNGIILEELIAPSSGVLMSLREYPVIYKGSLLARILGGVNNA
jgi:predicted deacylase